MTRDIPPERTGEVLSKGAADVEAPHCCVLERKQLDDIGRLSSSDAPAKNTGQDLREQDLIMLVATLVRELHPQRITDPGRGPGMAY